MPDLTQNQLRAVAGIILVILAIFYIYSNARNDNIEYIMIALAGSLVGISLTSRNKIE